MNPKGLKKIDLIFRPINNSYNLVREELNKPLGSFIHELEKSGLKGRGGAGFLVASKWKMAQQAKGKIKYIICNCDEGEPGTFKDREILIQTPEKVLTGMAIAAKETGAIKGFIYLRREYKYLEKKLQREIDHFNALMLEYHHQFEVSIFLGAGAYVCGEETALIQSMMGQRGEPLNKPPYPVIVGLNDSPTVINNVETLATVTVIANIGAEKFAHLGTNQSAGTKLFSVSGDSVKPGVYEIELGMKLDRFVEEYGDGDTKAVQVGGASGVCVPRKKFSTTTIGFEAVPTGGSMMLFNSSRSMFHVLKNYLDFFTHESCGQCTPCRVGCQQLLRGVDRIKRGDEEEQYLNQLIRLAKQMKSSSKCGLGRSVGNSFVSIVENFKEEMIY